MTEQGEYHILQGKAVTLSYGEHPNVHSGSLIKVGPPKEGGSMGTTHFTANYPEAYAMLVDQCKLDRQLTLEMADRLGGAMVYRIEDRVDLGVRDIFRVRSDWGEGFDYLVHLKDIEGRWFLAAARTAKVLSHVQGNSLAYASRRGQRDKALCLSMRTVSSVQPDMLNEITPLGFDMPVLTEEIRRVNPRDVSYKLAPGLEFIVSAKQFGELELQEAAVHIGWQGEPLSVYRYLHNITLYAKQAYAIKDIIPLVAAEKPYTHTAQCSSCGNDLGIHLNRTLGEGMSEKNMLIPFFILNASTCASCAGKRMSEVRVADAYLEGGSVPDV